MREFEFNYDVIYLNVSISSTLSGAVCSVN